MHQRPLVREGQRYAQRAAQHCRRAVWEVGAVHAAAVPIPHARLINVEDRLQIKTISCPTLVNPSFYELIAEAAQDAR